MSVRFFSVVLVVLVVLCARPVSGWSQKKQDRLVDPLEVTIARDKWGMPHIFGPTDPSVAYGLAWANAEDAFADMQEMLVMTKGLAGRVQGPKGAPVDYFVHAIRARETVAQAMETDTAFTPQYLRYLQGYCEGINAYARSHKDQVVHRKLFPVTPEDINRAFLVIFSALTGVDGAMRRIVEGKYDDKPLGPVGSNAFAAAPPKTHDNHTYLCINPHFRLKGPLSFYEAHLHSEEGLNITGVCFQGGPNIFMGANPDLGWGHTWNYIATKDVYRLERHPKKKRMYRVNDQWLKLEKRPVWLKVKVLGFLTIPVRKVTWWSLYGPTFESPSGELYAIRSPMFDNLQAGQQFYEMNRARSFREFKHALDRQGLGMFNLVYADRAGNLMYLNNGRIPVREPWADPTKLQAGNTTRTLWDSIYPWRALPHVINPDCGYLLSTNNDVFNTTCPLENDDRNRLPEWVNQRNGDNNRAMRIHEEFQQHDRLDFEQFKDIKFDYRFTRNTHFFRTLRPLYELNPSNYPDVAQLLRQVQQWDGVADTNSLGAASFLAVSNWVFEQKGYGDREFVTGVEVEDSLWVAGLRHAQQRLMEHFGTVQVPLKELFQFERGGERFPVFGYPDAVMANYPKARKDGTYGVVAGDTYIQFVDFPQDGGLPHIESLLPFQSMCLPPDCADQYAEYLQLRTKHVPLVKETVLLNAHQQYHPIPRGN